MLWASSGTLSMVVVAALPDGLPVGVKMPHGELSYRISGLVSGEAVDLSVVMPNSARVSAYEAQNRQTGEWANLTAQVAVAGPLGCIRQKGRISTADLSHAKARRTQRKKLVMAFPCIRLRKFLRRRNSDLFAFFAFFAFFA
jgi:hypothetical protein